MLACLLTCLLTCLLACLLACLPACVPACMPACLPPCFPACLPAFLLPCPPLKHSLLSTPPELPLFSTPSWAPPDEHPLLSTPSLAPPDEHHLMSTTWWAWWGGDLHTRGGDLQKWGGDLHTTSPLLGLLSEPKKKTSSAAATDGWYLRIFQSYCSTFLHPNNNNIMELLLSVNISLSTGWSFIVLITFVQTQNTIILIQLIIKIWGTEWN